MMFVDRVFLYHDSSDIKKFFLDLEKPNLENFSHIESWICTAIRRNVVELDLYVDMSHFSDDSFELPRSLFTCKTLRVLSLRSNFKANPPKSGCFPSLKVLKVEVLNPLPSNSILEHIFSNCPVLEDLRISGTVGERSFEFLEIKISAPELKRLTVNLDIDTEYFDDEEYNFYINAPKLEVFNLSHSDSSVFSFEMNAKSLFKSNINLSSCCFDVDGTNQLLAAISNVKQLSLSTDYLKGGVPAFDNLNHLELTLRDSTCCQYLIELLKRSPNQESLVIKHDFHLFEDLEFTRPEVVPVCMLSHLKTITFKRFKGRQAEMRMAQYFLNCSEVLNKMTITFARFMGRQDEMRMALYEELLTFKQGSKTCQVDIYN